MTPAEFIGREAAFPAYAGACCRMVDKWILERCGFSALSRFGRNFASQQEVDAWLSERGGIAVAVNRVMRTSGIRKTKTPQDGDVGLVFHARHGEPRLCMAILVGSIWVVRDDVGLVGVTSDRLWKAWSLPAMEADQD